jgi:hypothetical protein
MKGRCQIALVTITFTTALCACEGPGPLHEEETVEASQSPLVARIPPGSLIPIDRPPPPPACDTSTAPQIFGNTIVTPPALPAGTTPAGWSPTNGRLSRGGLEYTTGNGMRMELVTDRCTTIREVRLGSRVLTSSYDAGYWFSAQASTSQPTDPTRYGHNLWVFFPAASDGTTQALTIVVGRTGGALTTSTAFTMVQVQSVEGKDMDVPIGFSQAELYNMFGAGLAKKFGPQNSTVVTLGDGSTRRIYNYDPSTLSLYVDATGVHFDFYFKADANNYCDPTVHAFGTFRLNADPLNGLTISWPNPAQGNLRFPGLCQAIQLFPIVGGILHLLFIDDFVDLDLTQDIMDSFPDVTKAQLFLHGSTTRTGELRVNLKLPVPGVTIRVPYDAFDMARGSTVFPRGETLMLLASNLGMNDFIADWTPATTLKSGPNGVPRAGTSHFPRPQSVARTGSALLDAALPVGRLLARSEGNIAVTGGTTFNYEPGCAVVIPQQIFLSSTLRFGVNDTPADAQRLRGNLAPGYDLHVMFANDFPILSSNATRCTGKSGGGVISAGGGTATTTF